MKRLLIEIGMVLQVILFVSCNQWLDVKPSSEMEREELYDTKDGFKSALSGCYIKMKENMLYGQSMTMTTIEYLAQHWVTKAEQVENFMNFDWEASYAKSVRGGIWSGMYGVINQLNDLLIQMEIRGEEVLPDVKLRHLIHGEALALRAFCHFDILRLYGPSPVSPDKTSVSLPYSEESGKELRKYYKYDVYCEKIWKDLLEAERLLGEVDPVLELTFEELNDPNKLLQSNKIDDDFQAYRRIRFNYWAVKAFKARVALYLGDKSAAYGYAMEVINARVQEKPVGDVSMINADFSKEYYTLPSETLFALNVFDMKDKIESIFRNAQGVLYKWETEKNVLENLFEQQSSDVRYSLWIPMDYDDQKQCSTKKYWQGDEEEDSEAAIYSQQIPLIRMAEMYLIAIETAPTLTEKNGKLDLWRKDRGLPAKVCMTVEELESEVLKEYQKEFYAEGQMFFYYKRTGAKEMRWKEDRKIELKEYQMPLPESEFTY